ncbi:hypothetical protein LZ575_04190 [Antarcticibacterium sp. 1MA-6-2]|uniref:hypothetical protein n=1 Tax=Antarcticibacterium sp. 1MA-6-2 TaxID=2908210 RepID=UPI001F3E7E09|nr:hypothetical protein [Antarcticibacterium sp. 1MA-6-2]UJH91861.1 hypothetical protein LZ575_04190 [Antarcticibacterium sp. 1MA-6-2]
MHKLILTNFYKEEIKLVEETNLKDSITSKNEFSCSGDISELRLSLDLLHLYKDSYNVMAVPLAAGVFYSTGFILGPLGVFLDGFEHFYCCDSCSRKRLQNNRKTIPEHH